MKLKCEADTYFNYFVWDVKKDGRHPKQVIEHFQFLTCGDF